jgi:hypothetical protein
MTRATETRKETRRRKNWLVDEHLRLVVNLLGRDPTPQELKKYTKSVRDFLQWGSRWMREPERKIE